MKELHVVLETVTPMFLAGAEARGAPELRPPAFRGALRYWLRAAVGGLIGDDPNAVKQVESAVFGSAGEDGSGSSTIIVRTRPENLKGSKAYDKDAMGKAEKINKDGRDVLQASGRNYLYWSLAEFSKTKSSNYIPEGSTFSLTLTPRYGAKDLDIAQDRSAAALWLMLHLGGIGSRSRRTAGSLSVREAVSVNGLNFQLRGKTEKEIANELQTGLTAIFAMMHVPGGGTHRIPPAFDVLAANQELSRIWVLGIWDDVMGLTGAVEKVGYPLGFYRTYRSPDHEKVAQWLNGNAIATVERAAFGLPIPYKYSHHGPSGTIQGRPFDPAIERRASPLWLKISKTAAGKYVAIATLFKSSFLPAGEELYATKTPGNPKPVKPPPNYQIIEDWVNTSFKKSVVEVI